MSRWPFIALVLSVSACVLLASSASAQYSRAVMGGAGQGFRGGGSPFGRTASSHPGLGRPNNLSLVVAQTQEGHEGVTNLLEQLRRLQDQQVRTEVRFNTVNDSFFERIGVGFGFDIRGANPNNLPGDDGGGSAVVGLTPTGQLTGDGDISFSQGGVNAATPPFGGFDPDSQGTVGFANVGGDVEGFFNFFGGQGSNRSLVTQAPSVVNHNGAQGSFSDTSQTPFVTSIIPVVGYMPLPYYGLPPSRTSVLQERLERLRYDEIQRMTQRGARPAAQNSARRPAGGEQKIAAGSSGGESSADRGDISVADIRRQQANEQPDDDREMQGWLERARGAEEAGKDNVALIYYKMAARRASGEQKAKLVKKVRELSAQ